MGAGKLNIELQGMNTGKLNIEWRGMDAGKLNIEWQGMYGKFPVFVWHAPAGTAVSPGEEWGGAGTGGGGTTQF